MSEHHTLEGFLAGGPPYEISISDETFDSLKFEGMDMKSMLNLPIGTFKYFLFIKPFHEVARIVVVKYDGTVPANSRPNDWHFYGAESYVLSPASMRITWFIRKWI